MICGVALLLVSKSSFLPCFHMWRCEGLVRGTREGRGKRESFKEHMAGVSISSMATVVAGVVLAVL